MSNMQGLELGDVLFPTGVLFAIWWSAVHPSAHAAAAASDTRRQQCVITVALVWHLGEVALF